MIETIMALPFIQQLFLTCAMSGTVVFTIRMILMMIGLAGDHGDGVDAIHDGSGGDHEIGFDGGHHDGDMMSHDMVDMHDGDTDIDDNHDSDSAFTFLSIQGLTAFFMMFGWVGLAIVRDSQLSSWIALAGGSIAGVFTVWVLSRIFAFVYSMQSDGTMRVRHALGSTGKVYLRIPAEGTGQVQVEVDGRLSVFDASSSEKEEIKTGEQITVVWVQDNGILVVEKDERTKGGRLCGL